MLPRKCFSRKQITRFLLLLFCYSKITVGADLQNTQTNPEANPAVTTTTERPKIGLVLSGGGARGFAHIGVLKVLEENNVPIDYIVGTSMGSIIGGLYAIGLTPEDIEHGVTGINWDKVFDDFANRKHKRFRRKQDDFDLFGIKRIGITEDGLKIPPGIIEGQQIELALDRLAYPGFEIEDFDKLSIPYRAVATNIENGKPFVIKGGNIARAMRASMSIPGVLPAITIDDTLLVDGGIANNIPVDIVRDMGADIVIVVDVSEPLASKEEIQSGLDVTGQLTTIMTRRVANDQLATLSEQDVLIIPAEKDASSSDFNEYPALIRAGEAAANKVLAAIKKHSLSFEAYANYKATLSDVARKQPIIDFIEIKNQTSLKDEIMQVRIHQKIGEPLDITQLEDDLSYIYGLDYSSSVVYSVETRDGKTGLVVYVRDRPWAKHYLQFGLSIEGTFEVQSITNLHVAYTNPNLNNMAGEVRLTGAVGSEPRFTAEYFQPINVDLDIYVAAETGIETTVFPTLIDSTITSVQNISRKYVKLSTGKTFAQTTDLRLGVRYNDGNIDSVIGAKAIQPKFIESYYYVRLLHDSLDNLILPTSGLLASVDYRAQNRNIGSDVDLEQVKLVLSGAGSYKRYTILSRLIYETTLNDTDPANPPQLNNLFIHGGFLELSGTLRNELLGQHFGLAEAVFYRRMGDISILPMYAGFSLETGNAWDFKSDINTENLRYAGSAFVAADTFLGPVYLAIGVTNKNETAVYFNIGNTFLLR
ncbi:MAG: patatin-like phospholipase family protein [Gammaproteobacteria bacterium]